MNPQQPPTDPSTNQPNGQMFGTPFQQPMSPEVVTSSNPPTPPDGNNNGSSKSKLPLVIGVLAGLELLVIIILTVAVIGGSDKTKNPAQTKANDSSQAQGPTAATSSSTQLIDDSVTQDISSLNDDKDFPATKYSDSSLGL
jgi:hypothetical protein